MVPGEGQRDAGELGIILPTLLLIKHSLPEIRETIPAREWRLSEEGRGRCKSLAELIRPYSIQQVVSSLEPKAIETGQLLAGFIETPFSTCEGLHEHDRTNGPFLVRREFEEKVALFFEKSSELVMGGETADEAHSRFQKAVQKLLSSFPNTNLAVVAHGTVISLYVSRLIGIDPFPLWKQLGLPSFVALSLPKYHLMGVTERVLT